MFLTQRLILLAALIVTVASWASATPAFGQTAPVVDSRELVGDILDRYAPAHRGQVDAVLHQAADAPLPAAGAARLGPPRAAILPSAAAQGRAQQFLDRYAPGIQLGAQGGVRVETPGAVVDTRPDIRHEAAGRNDSMLHRLALQEAEGALRTGDLPRADRWIDAVATERPEDAEALQLQSIVRFRGGRFEDAADAARAALQHGAAWNVERLSELFPNATVYEIQFELLRTESKTSADGKRLFLLACHELMLGQAEQARRTLDAATDSLPEGFVTPTIRMQFAAE